LEIENGLRKLSVAIAPKALGDTGCVPKDYLVVSKRER